LKNDYYQSSTFLQVIKKLYLIVNKIAENLSNVNVSEFVNNLRLIADTNDFKDKKKVEEFSVNRLFLLLSILTSQKYFYYDEVHKKAFINIIEIIKYISNDNHFNVVNSEQFYGMLPQGFEFKKDILNYIFNLISANETLNADNIQILSNLTLDFCDDYELSKDNLINIFSNLGKICQKFKNYEIFHENNIKINSKLKELVKSNIGKIDQEIARIYFFIIFNNLSINNFHIDLTELKNLFEKLFLKSESKLINAVINNNLIDLVDIFESNYGSAGKILIIILEDNILKNAKLRIIFDLLSNSRDKEITFDSLTKNLQINLEDLEDVMFDAADIELFNVFINYEKNLIYLRYIRRFAYNKEYLTVLQERTSGLRSRLNKFIKKIDLLLISE
jgi:hypothetical protein